MQAEVWKLCTRFPLDAPRIAFALVANNVENQAAPNSSVNVIAGCKRPKKVMSLSRCPLGDSPDIPGPLTPPTNTQVVPHRVRPLHDKGIFDSMSFLCLRYFWFYVLVFCRAHCA